MSQGPYEILSNPNVDDVMARRAARHIEAMGDYHGYGGGLGFALDEIAETPTPTSDTLSSNPETTPEQDS